MQECSLFKDIDIQYGTTGTHLGVNTSVFVCNLTCILSMALATLYSQQQRTVTIRTEPCNRSVDINPLCLARPGQVGFKPVKETRGSDDGACPTPCQVQQVQHGLIPYISLSLCLATFVCLSLFDTPTQKHIWCANTGINI